VLLQLLVFGTYIFGPTASLAEEPMPDPSPTESTAPAASPDPTLAPEPTEAPTVAPEPTTAPEPSAEPTTAPSAPALAPTITSDKEDYPPGGTVILTGTNWAPGEIVRVWINDDQGQTWRREVDVTADGDGRISDQFQLPDWFVATYLVSAIGPLSGMAQTTFTDGNVKVASDSGRHFDYAVTLYSSTNCTTGAGATTTGTADGNGTTTGVGSSQSLLITANLNANAPNSASTFDHWTLGSIVLATGYASTDRTICVVGFQNGSRDLVGVYTAGNRAPVADDETVTATEDTDLETPVSTLLTGDTDADGDTLTVTAVSGATGGSATLDNNGTLTTADDFVRFSPTADLCGLGAGSYNYTVSDGNGGSDTGHVTVNITCVNDPPVVTLSGPGSSTEGETEVYTYTVSDIDSPTVTILEEACGLNGIRTNTAEPNHFTCTFPDGLASSTVKVTADDGASEDNLGSDEKDVTIANVVPVVTAAADQSADEGTSKSFNLGSFTDPGDDDPWTVLVNWGDGSAVQTFTDSEAAPGTLTARSHTYADDGTYTVTVTVRETGGAGAPSGSDTFDIVVANVAPTISALTITSPTGAACQGTTNVVRLQFSVSDPAAEPQDPITGFINWGDGSPLQPYSGRSIDLTHLYAAGSYTIAVTAVDGDSGSDIETTAANAVAILYQVSGVLQPVNDTQAKNDPSIFKFGNTIPVKVRVTDCNGAGVTNLAPRITVVKVFGTTPLTGDEETITNTNSPDSNGIMRSVGDGTYLYNLATRSLSDATATYEIRITGPFTQVIARFGTKSK
jgi:hypothetical protein